MAVAVTVTKPTGVTDYVSGNKRVRIRDITFDTGTYVTGGNTVTAAQVGLKRIEIVNFGTQVATNGTSGATANPVGVTYNSTNTAVTFQQYELGGTGAAGDPLREKDSAEATLANFTFRVQFVGTGAA